MLVSEKKKAKGKNRVPNIEDLRGCHNKSKLWERWNQEGAETMKKQEQGHKEKLSSRKLRHLLAMGERWHLLYEWLFHGTEMRQLDSFSGFDPYAFQKWIGIVWSIRSPNLF